MHLLVNLERQRSIALSQMENDLTHSHAFVCVPALPVRPRLKGAAFRGNYSPDGATTGCTNETNLLFCKSHENKRHQPQCMPLGSSPIYECKVNRKAI